jgi:mRNA-degrading endonuclease RelE of RelBE toxin-antitoxin system
MKIESTEEFDRQFKHLFKKYKSLVADLLQLKQDLINDPFQGDALGDNCYKVRMAITSKGKGKSGGARVITCIKIENDTIHLLTIFDKSDISNISDKYLESLRKTIE